MKEFDVVIIGAGPAGMTAGIYAVRSSLKTAVVSKNIGGTANSILSLENWPGYIGAGSFLMKKFYDHLNSYKEVEILIEEVESIKKTDDGFLLKLKKQELKSKTIIIATGTERKKLGIPGENELTGRGVSYCVTCDGFFFKNKIVGVVGGSDCAATSALALADIAKKVYIFYRGEKLRCEEITTEKIEQKPNTEIFYNAIPKKILGEEKVTGLVISENGKEKTIELDGIFVEIGGVAIIDFTKDLELELTKEKQIVVDDKMQTSVKGIFACGDVTNTLLNQVVIASAEGAIAARSARDFLSK